jgi:addiction module HigA family antidote
MPRLHPGKILLQQYLEPQSISQNKLARAIKVPPRRINEIVHEKRSITPDTAVRLAIYFGGSASYWMHLQTEFEIEKVKHNIAVQLSTIQTPLPTETTKMISKEKTKPDNSKSNNNVKRRIMR